MYKKGLQVNKTFNDHARVDAGKKYFQNSMLMQANGLAGERLSPAKPSLT
jgi:hypothetical protein